MKEENKKEEVTITYLREEDMTEEQKVARDRALRLAQSLPEPLVLDPLPEDDITEEEARDFETWVKHLDPVTADALGFVMGPDLEEHMRKTEEFFKREEEQK
jgi:hypothetical protein